ncbi:MAG: sialidase family protein [Bacillota bacterium]|nr:sialidase family protein [Bacillota bacterium]
MENNSALTPAKIYVNPTDERFQDSYRRWQGIPSIEVSDKGRIFVNFYSGQDAEVGGNIMVLCVSDDHGQTFRSCATVVEHPDPECRIYDPNLWFDPHGRLWMTYTQARGFNDGRSGVWVSICEDADAEVLRWSEPRRIANGIMMNKPTVLSNGEWLFPCAIWRDESGSVPTERHGLENEQFPNVYASPDEGKTITLRGHADVPNRSFDEHMIVEKKDGTLWMLVRTFEGIGESFSTDGGYTWSKGHKSHVDGPCSRFFIRRMKSGRLLMINHLNFDERIDLDDIMNQGNVKSWKGRSHLTAMLSEDDGATWPYTLLLDERNEVSYPDAKEAADGYIYVTYDRERVTEREILMARFTEQDILKGKLESEGDKLRVLVNKALGQPNIH